MRPCSPHGGSCDCRPQWLLQGRAHAQMMAQHAGTLTVSGHTVRIVCLVRHLGHNQLALLIPCLPLITAVFCSRLSRAWSLGGGLTCYIASQEAPSEQRPRQ